MKRLRLSPLHCAHCGALHQRRLAYVNRAIREDVPLYCNRTCAGLARRLANPPTPEQRKEAKRLYDAQRHERLRDVILAKKREYHKRTYDPAKAAEIRKTKMPYHVAYCRRPEYKAWKSEYDRRLRAKEYGEFADAFLLLQDVEREIDTQATRYEIYMTNGTINKAQARRRAL